MAAAATDTPAGVAACGRNGQAVGRDEPRRPDLAIWLSALSLTGIGRPVGARPAWEREATSAARSWLRLVDRGAHTPSWVAAAALLREGIALRQWDAALRAVRTPLGRCLSRRLRSRATVEGPAGAPGGLFVVIRFDSVFERRGRAAETITAVRGADARCRVAAYFIA